MVTGIYASFGSEYSIAAEATIIAAFMVTTLFRLDKDKLESMSRKFPASTAALHTYIVKVLSERLSRANRNLSRYI